MDDITRKFLEGFEARLTAKVDGMDARLAAVESGVANLDDKVDGAVTVAAGKIFGEIDAFRAEVRSRFDETMHRFQVVIDEAERIGALAARDRRVAELQAEVSELRNQQSQLVRRLEQLEAARGS